MFVVRKKLNYLCVCVRVMNCILLIGCLVSLVISASLQPIENPDNAVNENSESKVNHTYYHLFAQFGRNRFNFKPKPPKSGVIIQNNYKIFPQKRNRKQYNFNPAKSSTKFVSKSHVFTHLPYANECGRSLSTNNLIINGNEVQMGVYPWLAAIFRVKSIGVNYICSGSLISTKHVVTAGHCVKSQRQNLQPSEILVIMGKLNLQRWVPTINEKIIEPESIFVHPNYEPLNSDADIAVIFMSEEVKFSKFIRPVCLWSGNNDLEHVVGKWGTIVGWGKDGNGYLMTAEPKQTSQPIVSQEQCLSSSYQFQYITSNRTFCAGSRDGMGPCNGDSGSGFIMNRNGRWLLRGVVSMSISETSSRTCDLKNYVVFTDASKFLPWLLAFIQ